MSIAPQNLMSTLRGMPDAQLQQYAAMHKNDPFVFPLAFQESQDRQRARASQQAQGQQPMKVVDQDLQQMMPQPAPQPMMPPQQMAQAPQQAQQLPENTGIGQLPAPNLQKFADGGIVAFDEGGEVPSFSKGGANDEIFNNAFLRTLKYEGGRTNDTGGDTKYGISKKGNPDVDIDKLTVEGARKLYKERYWNAISGDKLAAVNPALAQVAFDTAVNQGVGKAKQYVTESGGDPSKMIQLRGEHYAGLVEKNPNKYGAYAKGWMNRLGNLATDLAIPSAHAGEIPKAVSSTPSAAQNGEQPLVDPKRRENYGLADKLLGPYADIGRTTWQDVGRNASNTLNALGGWTAPAAGVSKGVGMASRELAPTAEAIAEADRLKKMTELTRLAPPAKQGIAALDEASQATRAAAEQARVSRILAGDVQAAKGAEQSVKAADLTANTARTAEEALAAQQRARMIDSAKVANVGRGNALLGGAEDLMSAAPAKGTTPTPNYDATTEAEDASFGTLDRTKPPGPPDVPAAAATKGGLGDLFKDPMLQMGLHLMASKDPRFLGGIGEAGIATAGMQAAQNKEESERAYKEALAKHYGVDPMIQRLNALKDPETAKAYARMKELEREPVTREAIAKAWMGNPLLQMQYPKLDDYLRMTETAMSGASGVTAPSLSADQLSLIKKYSG
jgi:hypothetical protein